MRLFSRNKGGPSEHPTAERRLRTPSTIARGQTDMMLHPGLEPGCPTIARVALAGHLEPGLRSSDGVGTINEDHHP